MAGRKLSELPTDFDFAEHYSGLIFDCDGTLTDSMPLHYEAWRATMESYGIQFAEDRFYAMGGMPSEQIIGLLSAEQSVEVDAGKAAQQKESAFVASIDRLVAMPEVCRVAEQCFGRLPLSVASGGIRPVVDQQIALVGLDSKFKAIVTAEDTSRHKPDPDVFIKAAELMEVRQAECLVFEDSPLGFAAADAAGMDWIDVRRS